MRKILSNSILRDFQAFGRNTMDKKQRDKMDDDAFELLIFYVCIAVWIGFGVLLKVRIESWEGLGPGNYTLKFHRLNNDVHYFIQDWYLSKAGEPLTQRLRKLLFLAYLRQASLRQVLFLRQILRSPIFNMWKIITFPSWHDPNMRSILWKKHKVTGENSWLCRKVAW